MPRGYRVALTALLFAVGGACGSGSSEMGSGSGGTPGTGGKASGSGGTASGGTTGTSSGGKPGSGGVPGTGGSTATGGTTGSGGKSSSGGQGSGGATASGGATTAGGSTGSGGHTTGGATGSGGVTGTAGHGASGTGGAATPTGGTSGGGGASGGAVPSAGCGKTPTLKNSPTASANQNMLTVGGASRQFLIRWPSDYDNTHPYRLILDYHGATGKDTDLGPSYFGLFDLSKNTTIFVAPSASGGIWDATTDAMFTDQILKTVEADLCIDTSRVELEGFSQGAAMVAVLACNHPGVFRAAVAHSRGGLGNPTTCQPIPYLGSLGLQESGNSQTTQSDAFAKWDGCTVSTLPTAPSGGHVCTQYTGCPAAYPVIFCSFDGPHTASPNDAGKNSSWMPAEVWPFLSQF